MTDTTRASLTAHTLTDLVELVPSLLGFHPSDSLVVIAVEEGHVVVTARTDLEGSTGSGLARQLQPLWSRFPAASFLLIAFTPDPERAWGALFELDTAVGDLRRSLVHADGRHWRLAPADDGNAYDAGCSPVAAAAVLAGLPVLRSRAEIGRFLDPVRTPAEVEAALERAAARGGGLSDLLEEAWALVAAADAGAAAPTLDDATTLCLATHAPAFLERVVLSTDAANAEHRRDLWAAVVRASVPTCTGFALAALGLAAWLCGQGALQVVCLERMQGQRADPRWVALLDRVNAEVIPPGLWPALRAEVSGVPGAAA